MGGIFSKAEKEIKEEHTRKMNEETKRIQEEEEQKKKKIEEDGKAKLEEKQNGINEELEVEADKNARQMETQVKSYNEVKEECQKKLAELDEQLKTNTEKLIEEHKKNGLDQVTDKKRELTEEKEMLIRKRELLMEENNRLTEERQKMRDERSEMANEHREKEEKKITSHHEQVLRLNEEANNVVIDCENRQNSLLADHRIFQLNNKQQLKELQGVQMTHTQELMSIHHSDQQFEDFRRSCKDKNSLFRRFKDIFGEEECYINITEQDIKDGVALSSPPDLFQATQALSKLIAEIESFDLERTSAEIQKEFSELRGTVKGLLEKLNTAIKILVSNISLYKNRYSNGSNQNPTGSVVSSDIDDLDSCSVNSTSSSSVKSFQGDQRTSEQGKFDIEKHWKKTKKLIKKLDTEMLKFNVPASTRFEDKLAAQRKELAAAHSGIVRQITSGQTANVVEKITDGPSTSLSIQQVEVEESQEEVEESPEESN